MPLLQIPCETAGKRCPLPSAKGPPGARCSGFPTEVLSFILGRVVGVMAFCTGAQQHAAGAKVWDVTSLSPGMSTYFPEEEQSQSETPASLNCTLQTLLVGTLWPPKNNPPHRSPNKVPFIQQKRLMSPELYWGLCFWRSSQVPFTAARITPDSEAAE